VTLGGTVKSGNYLHDVACALAEGVRQSAVAGATSQATVNAAEITWARAIVASCKANNGGAGAEAFTSLLRALGTGGT
jgi:hypothetical protein